MGREVCRAVHAEPDLELVAAVSRSAAGRRLSDVLGLEGSAVLASDAIEAFVPAGVEVVVDFTGPSYAPEHIAWGIEHDMHVVVGTTGFDIDPAWGDQRRVGVVVAPNFAIGAVLMMRFAEGAARLMPDAEIVELHPPTKVDAPSGTARATAARIAGARGDGHGSEVPIHSVRLPGLVAHQEVLFGAAGQTLTIRHDTTDRAAFMPGVILAIRAVSSRPGLTVGLEALLPPA
jgi:4-hydroxy-tetrahydrodipicolinate reductase